MTTVAELVGTTLARLGVHQAFGVVGSGNFHVTNALRAAGVGFVAARHEGGAATMADAWARTAGRPAVLTVHQGCGLTNAMTGIAEAAKSRTPLLVLAADTGAAAVRSNFRIDQDALVTAVGAVAERVHTPASAAADVVRAYRTAVEQRRTVVLNLPLDVQAAPAPGTAPPTVPPLAPVRPAGHAVEELARLLGAAQRPVFVAGRGARRAGPELRALAEQAGALLATSAVAHGLFTGDAFALGISGGFASPLAAELISGADLVVGWGAALNVWTTRHGGLIGAGTRLVQVDLDADAIGAHRPVDLGVLGDVALTAADVLSAADVHTASERRTGYRTDAVRAAITARGRWRDVPYDDLTGPGGIDPRTLTIGLDDVLPRERTVAVDSGNFMGYPAAYLSVPDEAGFCFTQAFQSVGLGLATAIGAACARTDRLTVAALGDGGATMAAAELETVVRLGLPMVVVVYDDRGYGAEVHHFPDADHGCVTFPEVDLAAVGRGYGFDAVTVRAPGDLAGVAEWVAGPRSAPLFVHAPIASDGGSWWLSEAFRGH